MVLQICDYSLCCTSSVGVKTAVSAVTKTFNFLILRYLIKQGCTQKFLNFRAIIPDRITAPTNDIGQDYASTHQMARVGVKPSFKFVSFTLFILKILHYVRADSFAEIWAGLWLAHGHEPREQADYWPWLTIRHTTSSSSLPLFMHNALIQWLQGQG